MFTARAVSGRFDVATCRSRKVCPLTVGAAESALGDFTWTNTDTAAGGMPALASTGADARLIAEQIVSASISAESFSSP